MPSDIANLVECVNLYAALAERYSRAVVDPTRDPDDKENPVRNEPADAHYMNVGQSALCIIVRALINNTRQPPKAILDFPCGSGRVTRHLRAMFPGVKIGACDLYESHVTFCAKAFGVQPILSKENLDELHVGSDWDLVFCGSLLTHLPADLFRATIRFIARSLSPTGIAVVSLEGRHGEHVQDHKWKMIDDNLFDIARAPFRANGFGFVDYQRNFKANFPSQETYGITLVKPSWALKVLEEDYAIRILGFTERAWDDHQDVVVFGKPGVNA